MLKNIRNPAYIYKYTTLFSKNKIKYARVI